MYENKQSIGLWFQFWRINDSPPPLSSIILSTYRNCTWQLNNNNIHILFRVCTYSMMQTYFGYFDWRAWFRNVHSSAPTLQKRRWNITYLPAHFSIPFGMQTMLRDSMCIMRGVRIYICKHTLTQSRTRSIDE